jgi:hypothetical protein
MPEAPTDDEDVRETRPLADILRRLEKGRAHDVMSGDLQDLIAAVQDTGKAGKFTLQLSVQPVKGNAGMVTVTAVWAAKAPARDRTPNFFYVDDDHNLRDEDPSQLTLPGVVAAVPAPARPTPLKDAQ